MLLAALLAAAGVPSIDQAVQNAVHATNDGCRAAAHPGDITVCARQHRESDRYRLAPPLDQGFDVNGATESVSRERHRLLDGVQDQTSGSCSAVGASGATGCMIRKWRAADEQRGEY